MLCTAWGQPCPQVIETELITHYSPIMPQSSAMNHWPGPSIQQYPTGPQCEPTPLVSLREHTQPSGYNTPNSVFKPVLTLVE